MTNTEQTKMKAIKLVRQGMTYAQVAKTLGIPYSTVRGWCLKAGVKSPRNRTPCYVERQTIGGVQYLVSEDYIKLKLLRQKIRELKEELKALQAEARHLEKQFRKRPALFIKPLKNHKKEEV